MSRRAPDSPAFAEWRLSTMRNVTSDSGVISASQFGDVQDQPLTASEARLPMRHKALQLIALKGDCQRRLHHRVAPRISVIFALIRNALAVPRYGAGRSAPTQHVREPLMLSSK